MSPSVPPAIKEALTAMPPELMISTIWVLFAAMIEKTSANERERCAAVIEMFETDDPATKLLKVQFAEKIRGTKE